MGSDSMLELPAEPAVPPEQQSEGKLWPRYEDICQDGRLALHGMPHALGEVFWRKLASGGPLDAASRAAGVVPILSRLAVVGGDGPVSVTRPLGGRGCFELAASVDAQGGVERLLLNVWVTLEGVRARTHGPAPAGEGVRLTAGRLFAEHVFTRPFAAPGERRVRALAVPGLPAVPEARYHYRNGRELLSLPAAAQPLDERFELDEAVIVAGLDHTDSNQHVNSLVYPRWFLEAVLRRLAVHGQSGSLLARQQITAFRKPCFAGDAARVAVRAFAAGEAFGAVAMLLPDEAANDLDGEPQPAGAVPEVAARAHAYGLVLLGR